jgi:hypothetical protein
MCCGLLHGRGDDWRKLHRGLVLVPLAFHGRLAELDLRHVVPRDVSPYDIAGLMVRRQFGIGLQQLTETIT